jgi:hypothetical protein
VASISFPATLRFLSPNVFSGTPFLNEVRVPPGHPRFACDDRGRLFEGTEKLRFVPRNFNGNFDIPVAVREIGNWAFADCRKITSVDFPDSDSCVVESIGEGAFSETRLSCCSIPNSVKTLGAKVFSGALTLTSVKFVTPSKVTAIPEKAFFWTAIRNIVFPKSIKSIDAGALGKTQFLETVSFEKGSQCVSILNDLFCDSSIKKLELPPRLVDLQPNFYRCDNLETITTGRSFIFEDGLLFTKDHTHLLFAQRGIKDIKLPATVTTIGANAFHSSSSVLSATLSLGIPADTCLVVISESAFHLRDTMTYIGDHAFEQCSNLSRVGFTPLSALTAIGASSFQCTGLTSFSGPPLLASLGDMAFCRCSALRIASFGRDVVFLPRGIFHGCASLETVELSTAAPITVDPDAFLGAKRERELRTVRGAPVTYDRFRFQAAPVYERSRPSVLALVDRDRVGAPVSRRVSVTRHSEGGALSAVKDFGDRGGVEFFRHWQALADLRHPAVLSLIGVVLPIPGVTAKVVTEWMLGGCLAGRPHA